MAKYESFGNEKSNTLLNCFFINTTGSNLPCLTLMIRGTRFRCLADSGAGTSVVSKNIFDKIPAKFRTPLTLDPSISLKAVNGEEIQHYGKSTIRFKLGKLKFSHTFQVCSPISHSFILGFEFIKANGCDLLCSGPRPVLKVRGERIELNTVEHVTSIVRVSKDTKLPPWSLTTLSAFCRSKKYKTHKNVTYMVCM